MAATEATATSTNPTGIQYEINRGDARAVITEVGAGLRLFEVRGVPYVETFPAASMPPKAAGQIMLPWPNRVKAARWTFGEEPQHLEVTEPGRGNAIHGLTRHEHWQLVEHAESSITLQTEVPAGSGWPVPLQASIHYELAPRGLAITHQITNLGQTSAGVGVGAHPYLRLGDVPTDELTLTLAAATVWPFDDAYQLPFGPAEDVGGGPYDFRNGRPIAEAKLDTAFTGLTPSADGRYRHVMSHTNQQLVLWADPDFRWVQVFTPDELVGRGRAIAIEPMTCPPDALNSGTDLIELAPDETWSGSWGIAIESST